MKRLKCDFLSKWKILSRGYIGFGIFYLTIYIITLVVKTIISNPSNTADAFEFSSYSAITPNFYMMTFIFFIFCYKVLFNISMANGTSRKTFYVTTLLNILSGAGIMTVLYIINTFLLNTLLPFQTSFSYSYRNFFTINNLDNLTYYISEFLGVFLKFFPYCIAAVLISTLFYRLNTLGRIIVFGVVPAVLLFVFPTILALATISSNILLNPIGNFIYDIVNFFSETIIPNPFYTMIFDVILSIIFAALFYLVIRKCPVKAK